MEKINSNYYFLKFFLTEWLSSGHSHNMSSEVSSTADNKPVGNNKLVENPDPYLANPLSFHGFLREFIPECNFTQYLSLFCSFPNLIPVFSYFTSHKINLKNLDFSDCDLRSDRDIPLIFQLNEIFPNIRKLTINTRNFNSNVNDILRAFAYFKELEHFNVTFDSIWEKNILNVAFAKLKVASISINSTSVRNLNKASYLVENVLRYTTALSKLKLHNVVISDRAISSLLFNDNLSDIKFTNCKLRRGPCGRFKTLLLKKSLKHVKIREFNESCELKLTQILFNLIPFANSLQNLKTIAFNVFDDNLIEYQNIRYCSNIEHVMLYYFDDITPTFVTNFKNLIEVLRAMKKPFKLTIARIPSVKGEFNLDHENFMEFVYNLDDYFPEVQNICYYNHEVSIDK